MFLLVYDKSYILYKLIWGLNFVLSCGLAPLKSVQLFHYGITAAMRVLLYIVSGSYFTSRSRFL